MPALVTFILLATSGGAVSAWSAPFIPAHEGVVLETVRVPRGGEFQRRIRELRAATISDEANPAPAVALARAYLAEGHARNDPRFQGYAEAALARWWAIEEAPSAVLLVRATIRQSGHAFEAALRDLGRLLEREPENAQARLIRATVNQVTGRLSEAREDCNRLAPLVSPLIGTACTSLVAGLTGHGKEALAALREALRRSPERDSGILTWAYSIAGETADRLGQVGEAEKFFRQGLKADPADAYLLAALSDLLIEEKRPTEVIPLLENRTDVDNLLLRLALAEKAAGLPALGGHQATLAERFQAARLRGTALHQREEAIFALRVLGKAGEALVRAEENWQVQKEPIDARILVDSSLAAGKPEAGLKALEWMDKNRCEDVRFSRAAARLGEKK